jgi:hypothetical protein
MPNQSVKTPHLPPRKARATIAIMGNVSGGYLLLLSCFFKFSDKVGEKFCFAGLYSAIPYWLVDLAKETGCGF